jgi:hypothetical protein
MKFKLLLGALSIVCATSYSTSPWLVAEHLSHKKMMAFLLS